LNHPIRRRILRALVDESGSANTLSKRLRLSLGVTSYHLNRVLAKECGLIELVDSIPKRGVVEKVYRLKFQALTEGDPAHDRDVQPGSRMMSFEECFIVAVAAMDADAFETLEGSAWEWFLGQVDSEGWEEIRRAGEEFNSRARAAVAESRARAEASETHDVVVGVAAFPAISVPPPAP
jgi:DNA-binding transcriptional ArsR family regulator